MSKPADPDLSLILRQLLAEVRCMRDDVAVLTAIALRRDGTLAALLTELRNEAA